MKKNGNAAARQVLESAGIDIDEAANGVWMKNPQMDERCDVEMMDGWGYSHHGSHTANYRDAVNAMILELAGEPSQVILDSTVFKIPETCQDTIYALSGREGDDFVAFYNERGYSGLVFEELWSSE